MESVHRSLSDEPSDLGGKLDEWDFAKMSELRLWRVAGGVLRKPSGEVLLVHNRRRDGRSDWSTPGGVVDAGESFTEALTREVEEETGLVASQWSDPLYRVEVVAPGLGFHLTVEAFAAVVFTGTIALNDPDGIVVDAKFLDPARVAPQLNTASVFVSEPLISHLEEGIDDGRVFKYEIAGTSRSSKALRVS